MTSAFSVRPRNAANRRALERLVVDSSGMTLLEILVVMVILGLLATLGSIQLMGYLGRAKSDTTRLQMQELATALDLYRIDVGRLPSTGEGLQALLDRPAGVHNWRGPYLRNRSILADPWRHAYQYKAPGEHGEYDLTSFGADGVAGGEGEKSDIANWSER